MTRTTLLCLSLCLMACPQLAWAQPTVTVRLLMVGAETYDQVARPPLSLRQCRAAGTQLQFQVMLPGNGMNLGYLQVWDGDGCNTGARNVVAFGCTHLTDVTVASSDTRKNFSLPISEVCSSDGLHHLYFLNVSTPLSGSDDVPSYGELTVPVDTTPPDPPQDLLGGSGETQIPLRWTNPKDLVSSYTVLWDLDSTASSVGRHDAGANADDAGTSECGSKVLRPGVSLDLDHLPSGIRHLELHAGPATSTTLLVDSLGIKQAVVAVALVAFDVAGNPSKLSNIACLDVTASRSTIPAKRSTGGGGCSTAGSARRGACLPIGLALSLAALRLGLRRRQLAARARPRPGRPPPGGSCSGG